MKPALHPLRRVCIIASALLLTAGLAVSAEKKDEKKADDKKKPAETKKAPDAKAPDKDTKPATNAVPLVVEFPKSIFLTALDAGKDPFFPNSKRLFPKPPKVVEPPKTVVAPPAVTNPVVVIKPPDATNVPPPTIPAVTNPPPVVPPVELVGSANLSLRGISSGKAGFLATVHSGVKAYFFRKGEEPQLIRLPNDKQLKLRCIDITERSARFSVEGEKEPRELFLREGL
ncbi:MAG: hypothetical protein EB141_05500 [Verrucomicrobia bacterium]|nr:hypothetical protein [Verrucomicrobiota bacterium]NBU08937.1 hypothetical protein [Pseudomonadota bacterium]NDB75089.1 hypothetical protein [Verrucomicrobiota bacterium]NDD37211.1 hypothetical protein [Verrucomicrobiota bacterium]